jgi:hypothetical protein
LAAILLVACATTESDDPIELSERVHVARVDGSDVMLGAIVEGSSLTVYVCGGPSTFETHTRWFRGGFGEGGDADAFAIEADGFVLRGSRTEDGLEGALVEPEGVEHAFATTPTTDSDAAGLYTTAVDGCTTGVVVMPDSTLQGTYCNSAGEFTQVIILQPSDLSANGFEVSVERPDGPLTLFVDPV